MNSKARQLLLSTVLLFGLVACSDGLDTPSGEGVVKNETPRPAKLIVEPEFVEANLGRDDVLLIDARSAEAYAKGHLPGAVSLPYTKTLDASRKIPSGLPAVTIIGELLREIGVRHADTVITYCESSDYRAAARLFWVLEVHGHKHVAVMNDGIDGWTKAGRPLSTDPSSRPRSRFAPTVQARRVADKLEVARAQHDPGILILDTRPEAHYDGSSGKKGLPRWGHIPGAVRRGHEENVQAGADRCRLKSPAETRELYADLAGRRAISYCNSGRGSSVAYLALRSIGCDVAVYAGSFAEWSCDLGLPVVAGNTPLGGGK